MRMIVMLSAAAIIGSFAVIGISQSTASAADTPAADKKASCEEQRTACLAAKTQTGTNGVRYVPPEDVKACYDAYRACMGQN